MKTSPLFIECSNFASCTTMFVIDLFSNIFVSVKSIRIKSECHYVNTFIALDMEIGTSISIVPRSE